jgi:integrase/recombinase XerD
MKMNWDIGQGDFETTLSRYERYLNTQDLSRLTVKRYIKDLKMFLVFAKNSHPSISQAEEFRNHLIEEQVAPSSINTIFCSVKKFYGMYREDFKFKALRVRNTIPYFFSEDEVMRIFDAASHNIKHLAMLQTLFYGCLRANELCNLEDRDLDLRAMTIRIRHGKGNREAVVLISPQCVSTLRRYLSIRPPMLINNKQYLFFTDYGHQWDRIGLYGMFRDIKKRAKITSYGMTHTFSRHSPPTLMAKHGADAFVIQNIMRHSSIITTLRYTHVSEATKRAVYDKSLVI